MLTEEENAAVGRLRRKISRKHRDGERLSAYYEGAQRLVHLDRKSVV